MKQICTAMITGLAAFAVMSGGCAKTSTTHVTPAGAAVETAKITGTSLDEARDAYYTSLQNGTRRVRVQYDRVDTAAIYWATYESPAIRSFRRGALALHELWTPEQVQHETIADAAEETAFLGFTIVLYMEDPKDNAISLADSSPVKVFLLDASGKRFSPSRIRKLDSPKSRIDWLYPHKDRFSTVWQFQFPREDIIGPVELQVTGTRFASATSWDINSPAVTTGADNLSGN